MKFYLGETLFCWAFAIASMLRQSIIKCIKNRAINQAVMTSLMDNSVHKRIRDEILMIPIPKAKVKDSDTQTKLRFPKTLIETIIDKQSHHLKSAVERVSFRN